MRIKCVVKQDSKHDTSPKLVLAIEDSSFRVELPNEVQEAMSIEVSQIIDVMNEFIISTHYNIERVLEILVPVTLGTTTEWLNIYRVKK